MVIIYATCTNTGMFILCEMMWLSNLNKLTIVAPVIMVCCWFVVCGCSFKITGTYSARDKEPTRYLESNQPLQ